MKCDSSFVIIVYQTEDNAFVVQLDLSKGSFIDRNMQYIIRIIVWTKPMSRNARISIAIMESNRTKIMY